MSKRKSDTDLSEPSKKPKINETFETQMDSESAIKIFKSILRNPKSENSVSTETINQLSLVLTKMKSPCAITLDYRYSGESLSNKGFKALKEIDAQRCKLIKAACFNLPKEKQLSLFIAKVTLTHHQHKHSIDCNDRRKYNRSTILTAHEEQEIPDIDDEYEFEKDKSIDIWYNSEGKAMFKNHVGIPFENFFSKIFDFYDGDNYEKINSWLFEERQKSNKFCNTFTTKYCKYLLTFWPKSLEFSIFNSLASKSAETNSDTEESDTEETNESEKLSKVKQASIELLKLTAPKTSRSATNNEIMQNETDESIKEITQINKSSKKTAINEIYKKYKKRNDLFTKIPCFWLTVFRNNSQISSLFDDVFNANYNEEDEIIVFHHLIDVEYKNVRKPRTGFKISFHFDDTRNPIFQNKVITKEFYPQYSNEFKFCSTEIKWKENFKVLIY